MAASPNKLVVVVVIIFLGILVVVKIVLVPIVEIVRIAVVFGIVGIGIVLFIIRLARGVGAFAGGVGGLLSRRVTVFARGVG